MQIFQQLEAGGWSRCRAEGEGRGGKAKRGPVALVLRETEAANHRASPYARTRDVDVIGARNIKSRKPCAVGRDATRFSLIPIWAAEIASLLYSSVLSLFCAILRPCPAQAGTSVYPIHHPPSIHFPATAPRPPLSQPAIAATQTTYVP
jgi:hypothetical protein